MKRIFYPIFALLFCMCMDTSARSLADDFSSKQYWSSFNWNNFENSTLRREHEWLPDSNRPGNPLKIDIEMFGKALDAVILRPEKDGFKFSQIMVVGGTFESSVRNQAITRDECIEFATTLRSSFGNPVAINDDSFIIGEDSTGFASEGMTYEWELGQTRINLNCSSLLHKKEDPTKLYFFTLKANQKDLTPRLKPKFTLSCSQQWDFLDGKRPLKGENFVFQLDLSNGNVLNQQNMVFANTSSGLKISDSDIKFSVFVNSGERFYKIDRQSGRLFGEYFNTNSGSRIKQAEISGVCEKEGSKKQKNGSNRGQQQHSLVNFM